MTLLGPVMEMVMLVRCGEMLVRPTTWTLVSVWWRGGWAGIQTQPSLLSRLIEVVGRPQANRPPHSWLMSTDPGRRWGARE